MGRLGDPSLAVRNAALNAVSSTFSHVDETQIKKFTGLRVAVLTVVRDNLVARGDSASVAVSSLVAMATRSSAFFRDDLQAVVHLISQVTGDLENFEEDVKQLSLELGVTIIEGNIAGALSSFVRAVNHRTGRYPECCPQMCAVARGRPLVGAFAYGCVRRGRGYMAAPGESMGSQ